MKSAYSVRPIHLDDALRAYALVQMVAPWFPADHWAQVMASTDRWTLVSLKDPAGYVRGLAAYSIGMHPIAGRLMDVPIFVTASLLDEMVIADLLFTSLRRRSGGCHYMRFWARLPSDISDMENEGRFRRWDHGLMFKVDEKSSPALL